jgi:hypothetical protein
MAETIEVRIDDRWREQLGRDDERRVLDIAGRINERLGYAGA